MPTAKQLALAIGAAISISMTGTALAQSAAPPVQAEKSSSEVKTLQAVVVTGSHIRSVDLATSQPVSVITPADIKATGAVTVADVVQQMTVGAGMQLNPQYENASGGGTGVSSVSLRGLGDSRTLVLIDGHRMLNPDLNIIPINLVERVEVLKSGASAVYGSDAIGGVVNFILKKNIDGAEASFNYGVSKHGDGVREGGTLTFGQIGNKGSVIGGIDYNKEEGVLGAARSFSNQGLYLSNGQTIVLGSSYTPKGRIFLPPGALGGFGDCSSQSVTLSQGDGTSLGDYRCYDARQDSYNFQAASWVLTPSTRANLFVLGNYQLTDNIQAFGEFFYNNTRSNAQLAPDTISIGGGGGNLAVFSKDNMYNPFGVDFGGDAGGQLLYRTVGVGPRIRDFSTNTGQGVMGLKGSIGSWDWDAYFNYGRKTISSSSTGVGVFGPDFRSALGPSMLVDGTPTCVTTPGDPSTAIANCVPINILNQADPAVAANMAQFFPASTSNTLQVQRAYYIDANGPLMTLPAGDVQLAVGMDYFKQYQHSIPGALRLVTNPVLDTCVAGQGPACSYPLQGGYDVKEAYAELFIPLLHDLPGARSLSVDLGDRYSKYSQAGSTNNPKIGIMWRPVDDLLVRFTGSRVFRAPTISNLFAAQVGLGNANVQDPCINLSASELAAHSNSCAGVPAGWPGNGLKEVGGIATGAQAAGIDLKPEHGTSLNYGIVYDPHQIPGLSLNVDWWRVYMQDVITQPEPQTILSVCFGDNSSPLCNTISRPSPVTHELYFELSALNLGRVDMQGLDFGAQYKVPEIGWLPGSWHLGFTGTYFQKADFDTVPGIIQPTHMAGKFNVNLGNFSRFRGLGTIGWNLGRWSASLRERYVHSLSVGSADPSQNQSADFVLPNYVQKIPSIFYTDVAVDYSLPPLHAKFSLGVNNLFDRSPPTEFTEKNALNANTDIFTYDVIGQFWWARATFQF
jgi:outer membrane receptor protein involved in Fe transport